MGSSVFRPQFAGEQVIRKPWGLVINVDTDKCNPQYVRSWTSIGLEPEIGAAMDWFEVPFEVVLFRQPTGRIVKSLEIDFTDASGEVFQFPNVDRFEDDEGNLHLLFEASPRRFPTESWRKISWGGNADKVLDRPVKISTLHFGGNRHEKVGQVTLAKIIRATPREKSVERSVVSIEPIDTNNCYPGAAPFQGADQIAVRIEPPFNGKATLLLANESNTDAWSAKQSKFETTVTNGLARFDTRLSYESGYEFLEVQCHPDDATLKGPFKVVEARGQFMQTAAEAMHLEVDTGHFLHIIRDGTEERPVLRISNPARREIAWSTEFVISDVFGREIRIPFARTVKPGEIVSLVLPWPLPARGVWYVNAKVKGDDGSVAAKSTQFAYVDRHEVTPQTAVDDFRFGMHYHGDHYYPYHKDRTVAALVATGAKLVRTDYAFMFKDIMPKPDTYKWDRSDMWVKTLRDAGMSLDIIIAGTPQWSWDPNGAWKANPELKRHKGCRSSRPGLFREFCRRFAERYGSKIDYYELGNEWDSTPELQRTLDEAEIMHREGYEGVHAGYADAVVLPNGWGYLSSELHGSRDPSQLSIGLVERIRAKPELWDGWVFHNHDPLPSMLNALAIFKSQQEEQPKLKKCPWFLNESGVTGWNIGEDGVARLVWQKPLLAWSRGASAHVWYNLRATGWFRGSEPGFGVITPDYHPRASFAAYAALTTVFQGMRFDREMYSKGQRQLLCFKGGSNGYDGKVIVGWDAADKKGLRTIRLKTDAKCATFCDMMGNRTPKPVKDQLAEFELTINPAALLLDGASYVEFADIKEIDNDDCSALAIPPPSKGRNPDFNLDLPEYVLDFYANDPDPQFIRRLWTGPEDLSAKVWLERAVNGGVRVLAEVRDDVRAPGDGIDVFLSRLGGKAEKFTLKSVRQDGKLDYYDATLPFTDREFGFDIHILEDDGNGPDGYLRLRNEAEQPLKIRL